LNNSAVPADRSTFGDALCGLSVRRFPSLPEKPAGHVHIPLFDLARVLLYSFPKGDDS
jgi:hypothetical protein